MSMLYLILSFFFFNDTATTEIYTLSLHDALPISTGIAHEYLTQPPAMARLHRRLSGLQTRRRGLPSPSLDVHRSEEHTSELQSRLHLVCRLLLEKKKPAHYPTPQSRTRRRARNRA